MINGYEETWRKRMADYAPEARNTDWDAMRQLLPPKRTGGRWWKAGLLILLIAVAVLMWVTQPSAAIPVTNFPVNGLPTDQHIGKYPASNAPSPAVSRLTPESNRAVFGKLSTSADTSFLAPIPRPAPAEVVRPPALAIAPLPGFSSAEAIISLHASTSLRDRVRQLRIALPAGGKSGTNGYYPPTRIRE